VEEWRSRAQSVDVRKTQSRSVAERWVRGAHGKTARYRVCSIILRDINFHDPRSRAPHVAAEGRRPPQFAAIPGRGGGGGGSEEAEDVKMAAPYFIAAQLYWGHKSYSVSRPLSRALQQEAPARPPALYHAAVCTFLPSFLPSARTERSAAPSSVSFLPRSTAEAVEMISSARIRRAN